MSGEGRSSGEAKVGAEEDGEEAEETEEEEEEEEEEGKGVTTMPPGRREGRSHRRRTVAGLSLAEPAASAAAPSLTPLTAPQVPRRAMK
jgi:hypothetical protein